jgi:hypothetical protein
MVSTMTIENNIEIDFGRNHNILQKMLMKL